MTIWFPVAMLPKYREQAVRHLRFLALVSPVLLITAIELSSGTFIERVIFTKFSFKVGNDKKVISFN